MSLPKPYYQDDAVTIYHADCRDILPELPKVDLVLTDPPYGCNAEVSRVATVTVNGDVDCSLRDEVLALCEDVPCVVFGSPKVKRPRFTRAVLVWDKGELVGMGDLDFPWKPTHEEIYIIGNGFKAERRTGSVIRVPLRMPWTNHPNAVTGSHPTEKPIELIQHLLIASPQGTVLDPFLGSGTTAFATKKLGRKCIGIEIEEKYCEIAARRCSQTVMDLKV